MKIHTHMAVDLDAVASVWAAKQFIPGASSATVEFHNANWSGEMGPDDVAVDILAGGRGIKGEQQDNGTVHSCFASILKQFASGEDRAMLSHLSYFVEEQDTTGKAVKRLIPGAAPFAQQVLTTMSINGILFALKANFPNDDSTVCQRMGEIFSGMLKSGKNRKEAESAITGAQLLADGRVALVISPRDFNVNVALFNRGAKVVVYNNGNDLGVVRENNETLRMDHPDIQAVVREAGELGEWYSHPSGFLFCRGSRKAPAATPSKVNPRILAETVARLLSPQE